MKFFTAAFALIPVLAMAKVLIAVTTPYHTIGDTYDVEWLADTKMALELWLVKKTDFGWEKVSTVFKDIESKPCSGSYEWFIDDNTPVGPGYALYLNGQHIPDDGTGYAHMTDWFEIKAKEKELPVQELI